MLGRHTPSLGRILLHTHPMPAAELASFCGRCRWRQYQVRPQDRAIAVAKPSFCKTNPPAKCEVERQPKKRRVCKTNTPRTCVDGTDLGRGKCSDLGVPAPYGHNSAPMRVSHRQGRLIGESQERVARALPLTGDVGVSPTTKIPLLLARVRLITLCEVRNTAGPSHHDLVNGSLLMKSTKYEGRNCAYRCPLDL